MSCGCWSPSQCLVQNPRAPGLSDGLLWNITPSGPSRLPSEERAPHWDHCGNLRVGTPGWWAGGEGRVCPGSENSWGAAVRTPPWAPAVGGGASFLPPHGMLLFPVGHFRPPPGSGVIGRSFLSCQVGTSWREGPSRSCGHSRCSVTTQRAEVMGVGGRGPGGPRGRGLLGPRPYTAPQGGPHTPRPSCAVTLFPHLAPLP